MEIKSLTGFLLINKPANMTSFRCIGAIKRLVGRDVRVGHAGTLDHFATGLLIVGIGRSATKHLGLLLNMSKIYVGTGKFGEQTDTLDPNGQVVLTKPFSINKDSLEQALASFGKGYTQVPPVYSALKFQGQRLSDLYRASKQDCNKPTTSLDQSGSLLIDQKHIQPMDIAQIVSDKKRYINIYDLKLEALNLPNFTIQVHVSSGAYVRVLINDIAHKLDTCATTVALCRTKIGLFSLADALEVDGLDFNKIKLNLISVGELQAKIGETGKL